MSRKSLNDEIGVHTAERRHDIKPVRTPPSFRRKPESRVQSPAKKLSQNGHGGVLRRLFSSGRGSGGRAPRNKNPRGWVGGNKASIILRKFLNTLVEDINCMYPQSGGEVVKVYLRL